MPSPTPLEKFDAWELEEKLRHVRRVLSLPTPGRRAVAAHHRRTGERICWFANKATAAAFSCATVLLLWALFHSRADLVGPAIGAVGAALVAWPISRLRNAMPEDGLPRPSPMDVTG